MTNRAYKKVQQGYHGKNGLISDHTECTLCEIYSNIAPDFKNRKIYDIIDRSINFFIAGLQIKLEK